MPTRTTRTNPHPRPDQEGPDPEAPDFFINSPSGTAPDGRPNDSPGGTPNQGSPSSDSESYGLLERNSTFGTPTGDPEDEPKSPMPEAYAGPEAENPSHTPDSEEDAALSESESSMGSAYRPPKLAELLLIDERMCRAPMKGKDSHGGFIACVCGRTTAECKRHAVYRLSGKGARFEPGYYQRAVGVKGNHGIQGTYYSREQVEAIRREEDQELYRAAATMADDASDAEDGETPNPRRVSFGATDRGGVVQDRGYAAAAPGNAPTNPIPIIEETTNSRPREETTVQVWYGLIDAVRGRWVLTDLNTVRNYETTGAFQLGRIFTRALDAQRWKEASPPTPDEDGNGQGPVTHKGGDRTNDGNRGTHQVQDSENREHRGRPIGRKQGRSKGPSLSPPGSPGESSSEGSSTDHSSSTSDSSTGGSSGSSSSPNQEGRRRGHRRDKRNRKNRKANRRRRRGRAKGKKSATPSLFGKDSSVGDKDRVHGLSIHGAAIDQALGPPDMRVKDGSEIFNAATDVTALPGMFCNTGDWASQWSEETQATTEMAATLLSTAIGKKAQIHDSLWKTMKRHAMSQIKDSTTLFKFVKNVGKAERPAQEQQEHSIQLFMRVRRYDEDSIEAYVQTGFLPRLTTRSFQHYQNLLGTVRQLAFDHPEIWEGGPAKSMLDYHSEKLLQIRMHALTKKTLVLRTYTYLRDAAAKGFYHESMTESLWSRLASLQIQTSSNSGNDRGSGTGGTAESNRTVKCSHCKCQELHKLLRVDLGRSSCPLKDKTAREAKAWAKKAVTLYREDTSVEGGIQAVLERVVAEG